MAERVTQVQVAALLALAQDHAFGQPPGSQLRAAVLAQHVATAVGLDEPERATTWWTSTLRFLGCTGHAFETALLFGDEIELRAWSLEADTANPAEFVRKMLSLAGSGQPAIGRLRALLSMLATGRAAAEENFRMACEVADAFARRLGFEDDVRAALASNFERWNGRGLPKGRKGTDIPLPMRIAQLAQEVSVLARIGSIDDALEIVSARRGKAYDPDLADLLIASGGRWWEAVRDVDSWTAALAVAPPSVPIGPDALREVLLVLADFADLKSPWRAGHSRAVAELATQACGPSAEAPALLHDLGIVAVPNTIWDKSGPLTHDERDRMETHALITDQLLRRASFPASMVDVAAAAHERIDGSGYHRRVGAPQLDEVSRVVAAADCYQAMVSDRPHRAALPAAVAAIELRAMATRGGLDGEAVERVLGAAGHERRARVHLPAGLTARESEVLALLTLGLTTNEVADRLVISAKTADRHIQNAYRKIGVSTRGAAALFAIEHGILAAS